MVVLEALNYLDNFKGLVQSGSVQNGEDGDVCFEA